MNQQQLLAQERMKEMLHDWHFWTFIGMLTLGICILLFLWESHKEKKKQLITEKCRANGSLEFITDALQLRLRFDVLQGKKGFDHMRSAHDLDRILARGKRRKVSGIVCDQEIDGWVADNEMVLAVEDPEIQQAIVEAWKLVVDREAQLYLGLKLSLRFVNFGVVE